MSLDNLIESRISKPNIISLLTKAKMSEIPLIVVEGLDDIQFYSLLGQRCEKKFSFRAIENIENYSEGCDNVIEVTKDLQELFDKDETLLKFYLGIIDRDSKETRNELANLYYLKGLFILKYYSYESHGISKKIVKNIVLNMTSVNIELLTDDFIEMLYLRITTEVIKKLKDPTFESILTATVKNYNSNYSFSREIEEYLNNKELQILLEEKQLDISNELATKGIEYSNNLEFYKQYSKGKWLLKVFYTELFVSFDMLSQECKDGAIRQCQYCESNNFDKCLYKKTLTIQKGSFPNYVLKTIIDNEEVNYIIHRLNSLH